MTRLALALALLTLTGCGIREEETVSIEDVYFGRGILKGREFVEIEWTGHFISTHAIGFGSDGKVYWKPLRELVMERKRP